MNVLRILLKITGWKIDISVPYRPKCIVCVAPHTSNTDFLIGYAAWHSLGRNASFLIKEAWFFFPFNYLFRALGGIPVPKKRGSNLSQMLIARISKEKRLNLAVTPEGTRSAQKDWRSGFLHIATQAGVPIQLGVIDYKTKFVRVNEEFAPTGNLESDMQSIKNYYSGMAPLARYPDKFLT